MQIILAATALSYVIATFFRIREKVANAPMKNHSRLSLIFAIILNLALMYVSTDSARTSSEFELASLLIVGCLGLGLASISIEILMHENYFSIFSLPVGTVLLLMSLLVTGQISGPHFSQPWFIAHLIASITGECFFLIAAISSATYLFVVRKLKNKNRLKALYLFPPLARLDTLTYRTIVFGAISFLIGVLIGLYGNLKYFSNFTPAFKHIFSLVLLVYYGGIMIFRDPLKLAGPRLANAALFGFALAAALLLIPDNQMHWLEEAGK